MLAAKEIYRTMPENLILEVLDDFSEIEDSIVDTHDDEDIDAYELELAKERRNSGVFSSTGDFIKFLRNENKNGKQSI